MSAGAANGSLAVIQVQNAVWWCITRNNPTVGNLIASRALSPGKIFVSHVSRFPTKRTYSPAVLFVLPEQLADPQEMAEPTGVPEQEADAGQRRGGPTLLRGRHSV